jgi:hypothetical protein
MDTADRAGRHLRRGRKLIQSRDQLAKTLGGWVYEFPAPLLKPLGLAELLGAIGLIVAPVVQIAPIPTPLAAIGLVLTMIGAIVTHARRADSRTSPSMWCWRSWPPSSRGDDSGPTPPDHPFACPAVLVRDLPGDCGQLLAGVLVELDGGDVQVLLQVPH